MNPLFVHSDSANAEHFNKKSAGSLEEQKRIWLSFSGSNTVCKELVRLVENILFVLPYTWDVE